MNSKNLVMKPLTLAVGATVLWATTAAAQPAPDPTPEPMAAPVSDAAPPALVGGWSDIMISRPLTLPAKKIAVYGTLDLARLSFKDAMGNSSSSTSELLDLGFGYGVNDQLTVGAGYAFALHTFEIKGPLTLFGAYSLYAKDKLTIGASANLTINFQGGADVMGNSITTETLQAGLGVRYQVAPKVAIFTGGTPIPGAGALGGGIPSEIPMAGSVLGQHLSIGLNSNAPISFDIPVGVGLQASPEAFVWVNTSVAHLGLSNDNNAFLFADYIPLNIGLNYAVDKHLNIDAFLTLPDLKEKQFDLLFAGVGVRYYN